VLGPFLRSGYVTDEAFTTYIKLMLFATVKKIRKKFNSCLVLRCTL